MIIVADTQIPFVQEACPPADELRIFTSTRPDVVSELCRDADALLCRSTLAVNAALLEGSRVRFVATATSGTDHLDSSWLTRQGITLASAAGSNARSVAEYVFAAILERCHSQAIPLPSSIGIVGAGHVGGMVAGIAGSLGMHVLLCDPPLARRSGDARYRCLEDVLEADVVSLHVPLTVDGDFPTVGMMGEKQFAAMRPGALFLNTSRGGVVDTAALLEARAAGRPGAVVLDVFPCEPAVNLPLFDGVDIITPHIAGHSTDGKLRGTEMVTRALAEWAETEADWNMQEHLPPVHLPFGEDGIEGGGLLRALVRSAYDIRIDDADLRQLRTRPRNEWAERFASLRRQYRPRPEFPRCIVHGSTLPSEVGNSADALGFDVR